MSSGRADGGGGRGAEHFLTPGPRPRPRPPSGGGIGAPMSAQSAVSALTMGSAPRPAHAAHGGGGGGLVAVEAYTPGARETAREAALAEAALVCGSGGYRDGGYLASFNLLGVASNPRHGAGIWGDVAAAHAHASAQAVHGGIPDARQQVSSPPPAGSASAIASSANAASSASPRVERSADAAAGAVDPGRPPPDTPAATALSAATGLDLSTFTDLERDINEGLNDLTHAMNTANSYFSSLSSYYLGSGYVFPGAGDDLAGELEYEGLAEEIIEAQLTREEMPEHLRCVDLGSVEAYLRSSGGLALRFHARRGESDMVRVGGEEAMAPRKVIDDRDGDNENDHADCLQEEEEKENGGREETQGGTEAVAKGMQQMTVEDGAGASRKGVDDEDPTASVPEIFFSPYFDLTDPATFESLLVMGDMGVGGEAATGLPHEEERQARPKLMSMHPTEPMAGNLDTIELALLNQVRSKSSSFFRETNRFHYLQNQVAGCVTDVRSLREAMGGIKERTVTDVELIPIMDRKRRELRILGALLDEVQDVVEVKGSVAGLIAAGDYVGAVAAIQSARRLLRGDRVGDGRSIGEGKREREERTGQDQDQDQDQEQEQFQANMSPTEKAEAEAAAAALDFPLGRLAALTKVDDQLDQYESLVVNDLITELVETFLTWEDDRPGSSSEGPTSMLSVGAAFSLGAGMGKRARTRGIISALAECRRLDDAADRYSNKLCDVVRVTIKTTVTECASDALADLDRKKAKTGKVATSADGEQEKAKASVTAGVTSMTFEQFMSCLDMLFDQILSLLKGAVGATKFLREEGILLRDEDRTEDGEDGETKGVVALSAAADLSHKSISELLRLRKEAHSLITFHEMKRLWDACLAFTLSLERASGQKAVGLRSALLTQAKAFVERRHEANMASLVSALDSERWIQCDISPERQISLDRLCSGRAVLSDGSDLLPSSSTTNPAFTSVVSARPQGNSLAEASVEGKHYKVVWSSLVLVEMVMSNVTVAAHFQSLATNVVAKVAELLSLFNSRATQLVLGAGAIHSAARLKSINAKHLSLVTQCLGLTVTILPHIRAGLMAQLPSRQHALLLELDKIKKEFGEHQEKVLAKLVSIIGGIIERGLAPLIPKTDFDARSSSMPTPSYDSARKSGFDNSVTPCKFLEGIVVNARKMHQVLVALLPPEDLIDVFSRIFAYVDTKVPALFIAAASDGNKQFDVSTASTATSPSPSNSQQGGAVDGFTTQVGPVFNMPISDMGKWRMILEIDSMSNSLNRLPNVKPWEFTAAIVLERELDASFGLNSSPVPEASQGRLETQIDLTENASDINANESLSGEIETKSIGGFEGMKPESDSVELAPDPQQNSGESASPLSIEAATTSALETAELVRTEQGVMSDVVSGGSLLPQQNIDDNDVCSTSGEKQLYY